MTQDWEQTGALSLLMSSSLRRMARRGRNAMVCGASPESCRSAAACFFESLGFSSENPEPLIGVLRMVAQIGEVVENVESSHGEKWVVDGSVSSQTERDHSRMVRTVWIIDRGSEAPRLVTAYPGRSETSA